MWGVFERDYGLTVSPHTDLVARKYGLASLGSIISLCT